jgi:hypothetical protein
LRIDGRPVIALATDVPLWRDLKAGDRGDDVLALRAALTTLGATVDAEGPVDAALIKAFVDLTAPDGGDAGADRAEAASAIERARVTWLPQPQVRLEQCGVRVGETVAEGQAWATGGEGAAAQPVSLPEDATIGDRVLIAGDVRTALDASGRVTDPKAQDRLEALARESAIDGRIPASVELAEPITVAAVPPGAVTAVGAGMCVGDSAGHVYPVRVAGAQLGQSLIQFRDSPAPDVSLTPPEEAACTSAWSK